MPGSRTGPSVVSSRSRTCGLRAAVVGPPPQPGRHPAAVRPRLPDPVAPRDRVLLPAEARPGDEGAERLLRGRLRPRRGARGGGRDGRVHAPPAGCDRRGRARGRGLLPLQRGDGLVLPLPAGRLGGRVLPRGRVHPRPRRRARWSPVQGEPAWAPPLPGEASRAGAGRARAAAPAGGAPLAWRALPRGARRVYRENAGWLASGSAAELLRG